MHPEIAEILIDWTRKINEGILLGPFLRRPY